MEIYLGFVMVVMIGFGIYMFCKKGKEQKKRKAITYAQFLNEEGFIISKTQEIGNRTLYVDDVHKQWTVVKGFALVQDPIIYTYSDLIEFEVFEDGESIAKERDGGLLFGGHLTVVGGSRQKKVKKICTNLQVRIIVNDLENPEIVIPLINKEVRTDTFYYKKKFEIAEKLATVLTDIKNDDYNEEKSNENV